MISSGKDEAKFQEGKVFLRCMNEDVACGYAECLLQIPACL